MKGKRILALTLAVSMVFAVCACGNGSSQESRAEEDGASQRQASGLGQETSSGSPEQTGAGDVPGDETAKYPIVDTPVTVKGVVVGKDTSTRSDRLVWNKVSEITGIHIEWESLDPDALATYLAGGDWPDFIHCNLDPAMVNDYGITGGRFVNYLEYLDYMPNLVKTFEDYPLVKGAVTQINGEIYSLPGVEVSATTASARPYVRTDVLEDAGLKLEEIKTVDDFYQALVTLKEQNGEAGFIPYFVDDESYWGPMLFGAFGTLTNMNFDDDGNGNVIFNRTSEQMKRYLSYMNKLYSEGLIHQEYLTLDQAVRLDRAQSGKVALIGGFEGNSLQATDFADGEFHLDCMAPLTSEWDDTQEILGKSIYFANGGFFLNAQSDYIVELCKMFDIMYATEEVVEGSGLLGQSFCYGLLGQDWDYGPEGSGVYVFHCPEKYDGSFTTYQYAELIWDNAGREDALAGLVTETVGNSRARQLGFVNNVIPYQSDSYFAVGLLKFTDEEQRVLDNRLADITSYYKEMEGKFITGVVDVESGWENYVSTLDKMGVQDVIDVYQASYDRWNGR